MKKLFMLFLIVFLAACVKVGEFTPERHADYELGKPNCETNPEKCIKGIPW